MQEYRALRIHRDANDTFSVAIESVAAATLPDGDILVRVHYSDLNYKDALGATGNPGVSRNFPHTPGIDAAGVVVEDATGQYRPGDRILISGYDFGMNSPGGLAEYCRVPLQWTCPCPPQLDLREAMIYGTAGLTAAMCFDKLARLQHKAINETRLLISGASGGVGSLAIAMAAKLGYQVVAMSGKAHAHKRLYELGATEVVAADEWLLANKKALLRPSWDCAIDTLGGDALFNIIKATEREGSVVACGLAANAGFSATVYPFILRGVALLGVDSAEQPNDYKCKLWLRLATDLKPAALKSMCEEVSLEQVPNILEKMRAGDSQGRYLVRIAD
ncbi:YhdH/YhfP family quinone oxidoreductase [Gilvimarinus polysaccharolyticus]|uniref:YhdH/YhfP family quinone oxidoreductase n=1 Tax=Gilvimarinus polysaccharolyticus TaxID=863921 RepID=UPI0006731462|nr:YhdH/YhfP family quinone oxidoreductase [Gilvimarinus polysaccharolyticus]